MMKKPKPRYSMEEFARRGEAIYERRVRPIVHKSDKGKFVMIDIETEEFEIDADELAACDRLHARIPDAQIWSMRVGFKCLRRMRHRATLQGQVWSRLMR